MTRFRPWARATVSLDGSATSQEGEDIHLVPSRGHAIAPRRCCSCSSASTQGGCTHKDRWKPKHTALRDEENVATGRSENILSVSLPVDLAWSKLACTVR